MASTSMTSIHRRLLPSLLPCASLAAHAGPPAIYDEAADAPKMGDQGVYDFFTRVTATAK